MKTLNRLSAFVRLDGYDEIKKKRQKIAVRTISQFAEERTKLLGSFQQRENQHD